MQKSQPQEYAVLGFLMTQERHGYEIYQYFSSKLGPVWYSGRSQIYALLNRLETTGQVKASRQEQDFRPAKKIYAVTDKGRQTFQDWVQKPVNNIRDLRLEFLTKLYFLKILRPSGISEIINKQVAVCQKQLESLREQSQTALDDFQRLVFSFRINLIGSILAWLQNCDHEFNATFEKGDNGHEKAPD